MKIVLILLGCIVVGVVIVLFARRKAQSPVGKACSICGAESRFGYDEYAEDLEHIRPMCLKHLISQLEEDYTSFGGRAVVVQPADGPPCYVFQPVKEWHESFKDSRIPDDVLSLLARMETKCHDCGQAANYLWVESADLTGDNFGKTLDNGVSETLLRRNPKPISLCAKCCVKRISTDLETKHLTYLEVCAPKGKVDGFVIPMGY